MAYLKDANTTSVGFAVQTSDVATPDADRARLFIKEVSGAADLYLIREDGTVLGPYQPMSRALVAAGRLYSSTSNGEVGNTAVETSLLSTGEGTLTIPADTLVVGSAIRLRVGGYYYSAAADTDITLRMKIDTTTWSSITVTLPVSQIDRWWTAEANLVCRVDGASGVFIGHGQFCYASDADAYQNVAPFVNTAGVTVDTTATNAITFSVEWTTADASNSITSMYATLEVL